jgi:hypothetical protein
MNTHGYAIAMFNDCGDGKLEIVKLKEGDRVSAVEIAEFLDEYNETVIDNRPKYSIPYGPQEHRVLSTINSISVNRKDSTQKKDIYFGSHRAWSVELGGDLVDLSIAVNDREMTFSSDVDRFAKKKIAELTSEDELPQHHCVGAMFLAVTYARSEKSGLMTGKIGRC